jgi:hypothetical protein
LRKENGQELPIERGGESAKEEKKKAQHKETKTEESVEGD